MLRTWKLFSEDDLQDVQLYRILQELFKFILTKDTNSLLECCLLSREYVLTASNTTLLQRIYNVHNVRTTFYKRQKDVMRYWMFIFYVKTNIQFLFSLVIVAFKFVRGLESLELVL